MGSGVLLAALVVLWFVVLVPMVVTRGDAGTATAGMADSGRTLKRRKVVDPVVHAETERVAIDRETLRGTGELQVNVHALRRRTLAGLPGGHVRYEFRLNDRRSEDCRWVRTLAYQRVDRHGCLLHASGAVFDTTRTPPGSPGVYPSIDQRNSPTDGRHFPNIAELDRLSGQLIGASRSARSLNLTHVEADLRRLGGHAAISVPGVPDEVLPEYVPRDTDAAGHGVRAKVAAAAERGGFVLLVGGSSVGKTRCAAEAVKALLPDWQLVHPAGPDQVATLAAAPPERTVVWLGSVGNASFSTPPAQRARGLRSK